MAYLLDFPQAEDIPDVKRKPDVSWIPGCNFGDQVLLLRGLPCWKGYGHWSLSIGDNRQPDQQALVADSDPQVGQREFPSILQVIDLTIDDQSDPHNFLNSLVIC